MCGIVGYIGEKKAVPILLDGLSKLEYRGYDSAGFAVAEKDGIKSIKRVGKVNELTSGIKDDDYGATVGIAHTRWATHGQPTEDNAHPHRDCQGEIYIVHNGIIENYHSLRQQLAKEGHKFYSDTDTEVVAHLIEKNFQGGKIKLEEALQKALSQVVGTYGIVVMAKKDPDKLVVARNGSPLVLGVGQDEYYIASDVTALLSHTREVIYLNDGEMAVITKDDFVVKNLEDKIVIKDLEKVDWDVEAAEKGEYKHFMLKEIFEEPEAVRNSIRGRLNFEEGLAHLGGLKDVEEKLQNVKRIIIIACGTALYAGMVGRYMLEEYAGIPVEVDYASEFRYRKAIVEPGTAIIAISQSGETADTLAAIREAKRKGALTLGIVNVVGSTIARETDAGVYNHVGPEIGVASTKAFVSQLTILALFTLMFGRQRDLSLVMGKRIAEELQVLPEKIQSILDQSKKIQKIAKKYSQYKGFLYLGRKYNYPLAMEGALKLKEISYIHAEGYPSGEMKHGPIALIDPEFPTVAIAPKDSVYDKVVSNLEEVRARKGKIVAITTEGNKDLARIVDDVIYIPKTLEMLTPILAAVPAHLLAYYIAEDLGQEIDKPRNLAKSVTVE